MNDHFRSLGDDVESLLRTFCRNVIGNAAGMYLFREYLRGTCGARVISCWMHVQTFRKTQDLERRVELFSAIRRLYLHPIITLPGPGCLSDIVAAGEKRIRAAWAAPNCMHRFYTLLPTSAITASSAVTQLSSLFHILFLP